MRLKRLSIAGFKSFMDRLDLALPEGISAIVGPNGSGKSNIVDAIRWAMGEQSAKQLRGRQMEDVIFNGAGEFKPLGMAEVSLVFENGDGSFPGEYQHLSELAVTRRLYRSGESEYLINRVPCRLKDISEVFMDTGLGNKAYSIIGQGRISSIIEQRPEETRAMLEEAAGITKYRKKVDESQRKLDMTRANLQRVEDILSEVERQVRSLKRQAAKARRFKELSTEMEDLEIKLHSHTYHEHKEESGRRSLSVEALVREESDGTSRLAVLHADVERMRLELSEMDEEIGKLREVFLKRKESISRKESMLESLQGEKRTQVALEKRLGEEREDIERRLRGFEQERLEIEDRLAAIQQNTTALREEFDILEQRLKRRSQVLREVRVEVERARAEVNKGQTREVGLNQESGYLSKRIQEITDGRARLEQEKQDVDARVERLDEASLRKAEIREALAEKLARIEEDLGRVKEERQELELVRRNAEADRKKAESDLAGMESRLASLRSLADNFEGFKVGVRTIMKADDLEARRQGRVRGLVADVVQVDPEIEQAVESVLADRLQYVIVDGLDDGREGVYYLKARSRGRGSFVPIKALHSNGNGNGSSHGLPLLRDRVTLTDEAYRPLLNMLLGDTALVSDLDQALEVWSGNGSKPCLVTPDGDMIDERGVISGGKAGGSSHGLLARKREMQDLEAGVRGARETVNAFDERLEQIDMDTDEKRSRLEMLDQEREDCREEINTLDRNILQLSNEMDQMERFSERIAGELEQKEQEKEKHREALGRIEGELSGWREKIRENEGYLREKEIELREMEEEAEQSRNELGELKVDLSRAGEEEKGLQRQMERIDDYREEAVEKLEKIEEDKKEARRIQAACDEREEVVRSELRELYERLAVSEEAVNRAGQERGIFQNRIREEEKKSEALRVELAALKDRINRARMEQSEIHFQMNGLVERVRDKYNMELAEIYRSRLEEGFSESETKEALEEKKGKRERLGEVNLAAIHEHEALTERHTFIVEQRDDLLTSIDSLNKAIQKINRISLDRFTATLREVDAKLKEVFPILFKGGTAGLRLTDESRPLESGVLVEVRPPGKRLSHMGLLSGGEKALVAMALLFAIYLIKPSPFCLLDEVDAPLDEANIDRFNNLLMEIRKYSQVILVTHNRRSMEIVERLYGVTMEKAGVSKMVSVNLGRAERLAA